LTYLLLSGIVSYTPNSDHQGAILKKKAIAFFPAHPSQIWMLRPVADELSKKYEILWFLRDKDVACSLAQRLGLRYEVLSKASRGIIGNAWELFLNIFKCIKLTLKYDIKCWVTKYGCGNIAARLLHRGSVSFSDDDIEIIPLTAISSYPFADVILAPAVVRMGKYRSKTKTYQSCHELFYLRPGRFTPSPEIYQHLGISPDQRYGLVRLSALQAHHDVGIKGVSEAVLDQLIQMTQPQIKIFITSEKSLEPRFEPYRLPIPVDRIFDALYYAEFLVSDSQTMTSEAAVLGTPSFRLSDFVGRLSVIGQLEEAGISFGFKPHQADLLLQRLNAYLGDPEMQRKVKTDHERFIASVPDAVPIFADAIDQVVLARIGTK